MKNRIPQITTQISGGGRLVVWGLFFLFYFLLNSTLTLHRWLLGDGWWYSLVPALESLVLILGVFLASRSSKPWRRYLLIILGIFYGSFVIYSGAEYVVQLIYARPFLPQADIPMIRGVLLLLFGQIGDLADILTPITQGFILLITWALAFAFLNLGALVFKKITNPKLGFSIFFASSLILMLLVPQPTVLTQTVFSGLVAGRPQLFTDAILRSQLIENQGSQVGQEGDQIPEVETPNYVFPGILDRDIYVFVIEAYGYAAHSRDDLFDQLEPDFQRFQDVLTNFGYGLVSNYMLSPVAGGFSWLAEASFITGQWINSQPVFLQLYEQPVSSLPGFLYDGGYYTFTVKPGTVHGSWPEGWDLFRFREAMIAYDGDFNFRGPWFSYVPITDQFALHAAHQRIQELRSPGGPAEHRPLFAHYQLVSSHTPFNKIPPYLENWDDLGDGSIYHQLSEQILTFDNTWTGGSQLDEGFVASISYVFTVISEYLDRFMDHEQNPIIIIFGDHQPQRPIREQTAHLSVPIHIASRDPEILEQFQRLGFTSGFRGNQPPPHFPMSDFFPKFVNLALTPPSSGTNRIEVLE